MKGQSAKMAGENREVKILHQTFLIFIKIADFFHKKIYVAVDPGSVVYSFKTVVPI